VAIKLIYIKIRHYNFDTLPLRCRHAINDFALQWQTLKAKIRRDNDCQIQRTKKINHPAKALKSSKRATRLKPPIVFGHSLRPNASGYMEGKLMINLRDNKMKINDLPCQKTLPYTAEHSRWKRNWT
jgi:hypothetical protein